MVKISQAQTPVGSIQGGVPLSRVNTILMMIMMMMMMMIMMMKTTLSVNGSCKSL